MVEPRALFSSQLSEKAIQAVSNKKIHRFLIDMTLIWLWFDLWTAEIAQNWSFYDIFIEKQKLGFRRKRLKFVLKIFIFDLIDNSSGLIFHSWIAIISNTTEWWQRSAID